MYLWIRFKEGKGGFVEADSHEEALRVAREATGRDPVSAHELPYPADPIIYQRPGTKERPACPAFCYRPEQCAGRGSCPQSYACSE